MISCFYINLNDAVNRRKALEESFRRVATKNFSLQRIIATTKHEIHGTKPKIRTTDSAVNRSHLHALIEARKKNAISIILEDDTFFFKETFLILEKITQTLNPNAPIVLYTDIMLTTPNSIVQFQKAYEPKKLATINLNRTQYAGASCYLVTPSALDLLLPYAKESVDKRPWDMTLRALIHNKKITGKVITPFITSVSKHADKSSNQPDSTLDTDFIWNTFRRSISLHPEIFDIEEASRKINQKYATDNTQTMMTVLAAHASKKFRNK